MSFWSDIKWRSRPLQPQIVEPFDSDAIEDANYLLSIGDEIYVSSPEAKSTIQTLTAERPHFAIEPGQFAFLLTAENVSIPFDTIGFISIRATIKFMGLVNISGFHVDPGYSGKLIFAVFNAGPTRIHLKRGQRIFPLWLAALDSSIKRTERKSGYDRIPPTLVTQISGNFTTAYQLKTELDKIKEDVAKLKAFKYYAAAILAVLGLILFPIIKDRIIALFVANPPAVTQVAPAPSLPQAPPAKSEDKK
jgi:dCTP deaminase